MYIELPQQFKLSFAKIVGNELLLYRLIRFEDVMYELTYALKEKVCVYCGQELKADDSTLDHRYPRDTGGISITNNLFPCCSRCNSNKSNLTHEEYLNVCKLSKEECKKYLIYVAENNKKIMKKIGYKLPRKWVTYEDVCNISYETPVDTLRGKRYRRILEFYKQYGKLPRPAIIDKYSQLLDGYNVLLFAKDWRIQRIPVIKLENVELLLY